MTTRTRRRASSSRPERLMRGGEGIAPRSLPRCLSALEFGIMGFRFEDTQDLYLVRVWDSGFRPERSMRGGAGIAPRNSPRC